MQVQASRGVKKKKRKKAQETDAIQSNGDLQGRQVPITESKVRSQSHRISQLQVCDK